MAANPIFDDIAPMAGPGTACIDYIDLAQIWLPNALRGRSLRRLVEVSVHPVWGAPFIENGPARFDPMYRQRIRLCQPTRAAVDLLAEQDGALLNSAEIARDRVFDDDESVQASLEYYRQHFVQRWHGKKQVRVWDSGNFRTGDLEKPGVVFQGYGDRPCRVTGEIHCFHFEAKLKGVEALRRARITNLRDLIDFDFDAFWQRHELLLEVDRERLGRFVLNRVHGTNRRAPLITRHGPITYNWDRAAGGIIWRASNQSSQGVVDRVGRGPYMLSPRKHHSADPSADWPAKPGVFELST